MENELITLLRQEIPTGYQKQLSFYRESPKKLTLL